MGDSHKNGGNKVVKIVVSVVFLTWFVVSLGGIIYFSRSGGQKILSLAILGQYLLVFGLVAIISGIKNKQFQPITVVFPVVGIGMILGAFIAQFGSESVVAFAEANLPYLFLFILLCIGIALLVAAFGRARKKHGRCTYAISGTCVEVDVRWENRRRCYCPTYEVYFQEEMIRLCNHEYTNRNPIKVGDRRELFLNPKKPTEFYEITEEKLAVRALCLLGAMCVAVSILGFVMTMFVG